MKLKLRTKFTILVILSLVSISFFLSLTLIRGAKDRLLDGRKNYLKLLASSQINNIKEYFISIDTTLNNLAKNDMVARALYELNSTFNKIPKDETKKVKLMDEVAKLNNSNLKNQKYANVLLKYFYNNENIDMDFGSDAMEYSFTHDAYNDSLKLFGDPYHVENLHFINDSGDVFYSSKK